MNVFAALADPTRLQIFELIAHGEKTVGEILARLTVTAPAVSQHLKVLRDANLVSIRREGQRRYYSIKKDELTNLENWIDSMTEHWDSSLDLLEQAALSEKTRRKKHSER